MEPIDQTTATFKVKVKVGYLSKTFDMKARYREMNEPSRLTFSADGPDAEISGIITINAKQEDPGVSLVKYRIEIRPISVTGKTAVAMIGKDLVKKQSGEFAECVKTRLKST